MYTQDEPIEVFDHDWKSLADGVAIPHGLYDLNLNIGYIHIGTSHDTSAFACDALRQWWLATWIDALWHSRFDSAVV